MQKVLKRTATLVLASTLLFGTVQVSAATSSPTESKEDGYVAKKVKRIIYYYKTTKKGTATSFKVIKKKNKVKVAPIVKYIKYKGKKYKVVKVGKNTFKGCKRLRKIQNRPTKAIKFAKGAFNGVNTKKITLVVNKKMSAAQFKLLKKRVRAVGFKGKIKRGKVK